MDKQVVEYLLGDGTRVGFEIDAPPGFHPAGRVGEAIGKVREAVVPAARVAQEVLAEIRAASRPEEVQVRFGVKVSGETKWLVASANGEANFEITLIWRAEEEPPRS